MAGKPPRLVEHIGGGTNLLTGADAVSGGRRVAEAPVLIHDRLVLFTPREVVVEATGRHDHPRLAKIRCGVSSFTMTAPVTDPSSSAISWVIGEFSHSGIPRSFIANRNRAASD